MNDLFPEGRTIFYEGDDPDGFRRQIKAEFGFDPADRPGLDVLTGEPMPESTWNAGRGWQFHCPAAHLRAIYDTRRFPMGS